MNVVLRSGGLGDFVLTLPLLRALHESGRPVRLLAHRQFLPLLEGQSWAPECVPLEAARLYALGHGVPSALFEGADVLSFWPDRDGRLAASAAASGAQSFVHLNPRPQVPPHAMEHMFAEAGLTPPEDLLEQSVLQRSGTGRGVLWLHPGSGSPAKNAPLSEFAERARHSSGPVIVSMGEVEDSEGERYRAAFADTGAELWRPTDVAELRDRLGREASGYVGNDSGPTHLAAALGIPTLALFLTTDPRIWRPAGADVRV